MGGLKTTRNLGDPIGLELVFDEQTRASLQTEAQFPEREPALRRNLRIVGERRWLIIASLLVGGAGYAAWATRTTKIYQASASILVDLSPPPVLGGEVREAAEVGPGVDAGAAAKLDRYIGYYEPYATSHDTLDHDEPMQEETRNVARAVAKSVVELRAGRLQAVQPKLSRPRPK